MDNLKPCPFCGSDDVRLYHVIHGTRQAIVSCLHCAGQGPGYWVDAETVNRWNTRAPDPLHAAVDALLAVLDDYSAPIAKLNAATAAVRAAREKTR